MENKLAPMTWGEFKRLEKDEQQNYLRQLSDNFGAGGVSLAKMFNIAPQTFRKYIVKAGLDITFTPGNHLKKELWNEFLAVTGESNGLSVTNSELSHQMTLHSLSMQFTGKIDVDMISAALHKVFDGVDDGEISIFCEIPYFD